MKSQGHRIKIKPRAASAVLAAALFACASPYTLTPNARALKARLDDDEAVALLQRAMENDPDGRGGLYLVGPAKSHAYDVQIEDGILSYATQSLDHVTGAQVQGNAVVGNVESTPIRVEQDLRRTEQIQIKETEGNEVLLVPGYLVWLFGTSRLEFVIINVSKEELDPLLAAATHFAPKAPMSFGGAF